MAQKVANGWVRKTIVLRAYTLEALNDELSKNGKTANEMIEEYLTNRGIVIKRDIPVNILNVLSGRVKI